MWCLKQLDETKYTETFDFYPPLFNDLFHFFLCYVRATRFVYICVSVCVYLIVNLKRVIYYLDISENFEIENPITLHNESDVISCNDF